MQRGDLFMAPNIGSLPIVACVLEVKKIGSMDYVDAIDEFGFRALRPVKGLCKKAIAVTVGENEAELKALRNAMEIEKQ